MIAQVQDVMTITLTLTPSEASRLLMVFDHREEPTREAKVLISALARIAHQVVEEWQT